MKTPCEGQVEHLVIAVHPMWRPPSNNFREFSQYGELLSRVATHKHTALMITRMAVEGGDTTDDYIKRFRDFTDEATGKLGDRFLDWDKKWLSGDDLKDVDELASHFRLAEATRNEWSALNRKPRLRLLGKISIFGREPGTCPVHQAYGRNLQSIAEVVKLHNVAKPELEVLEAVGPRQSRDGGMLAFRTAA